MKPKAGCHMVVVVAQALLISSDTKGCIHKTQKDACNLNSEYGQSYPVNHQPHTTCPKVTQAWVIDGSNLKCPLSIVWLLSWESAPVKLFDYLFSLGVTISQADISCSHLWS